MTKFEDNNNDSMGNSNDRNQVSDEYYTPIIRIGNRTKWTVQTHLFFRT